LSIFTDKMEMDMQLRGFSPHTKAAYRSHLKHFEKHFGKPAEQMGEEEIRQYLHYGIIHRKLSSSYASSCYCALKFFFETTLKREWDNKNVPRVKTGRKLPAILSKEELILLFNVTNNLKHKAILMTAYGAGLRVSEIANLKISDIDSKNMQIIVSQGKGNVDRYSVLSQANLTILREYYKQYHPKTWLFPGQDPVNPLNRRSIHRVFKDAKRKAGISKNVSIHSLRHSFATHLLEDNVNICHIQKLLGHRSIRTTCLYLHLTRMSVLNVKSPLDTMDGFNNG
jgi:integrase/recombinase XerD